MLEFGVSLQHATGVLRVPGQLIEQSAHIGQTDSKFLSLAGRDEKHLLARIGSAPLPIHGPPRRHTANHHLPYV